MDVKFYDYYALQKDINRLISIKEHFVISSTTLLEVTEYNSFLEEKLMNNEDLWELWENINIEENPAYTDLYAALDYDEKVKPDATIFVTGSYAMSKIANLYFGEDSIIYIQ